MNPIFFAFIFPLITDPSFSRASFYCNGMGRWDYNRNVAADVWTQNRDQYCVTAQDALGELAEDGIDDWVLDNTLVQM